MAQITVTPRELRTKASNLRELNSSFKTQVEALTTSEGTLSSMWKGAANDKFHAAFNSDKVYMTQFATEIEKYCQALETIATEYDKAEALNAETASTRR